MFADWPAPEGIRAVTTLRCGPGRSRAPFDVFNLGARCGDDPGAVAANRARLVAALGLPQAPCWLQQVHGVGVWDAATPPIPDVEPVADAAVSDAGAAVLAVLTADCLPVVFSSDNGQRIGAAHAGWRGLAAGVLEATVSKMAVAPERLLAWLGPGAGPAAYEIGAEVREAFLAVSPEASAAFESTRPGHWRVDLYRLARQRLTRVGVNRIYGGERCTISEPAAFYSHRRDQRTGRMATLIWRG